MIVSVTRQFSGESAQLSFIDLDKVTDKSRKSVKIFAEAVKQALANPNKYATCPYHTLNSAEYFMGPKFKASKEMPRKLDHDETFVKPPCHVDASVTLFEDENSDYEDEDIDYEE